MFILIFILLQITIINIVDIKIIFLYVHIDFYLITNNKKISSIPAFILLNKTI